MTNEELHTALILFRFKNMLKHPFNYTWYLVAHKNSKRLSIGYDNIDDVTYYFFYVNRNIEYKTKSADDLFNYLQDYL